MRWVERTFEDSQSAAVHRFRCGQLAPAFYEQSQVVERHDHVGMFRA